MLVCIKIEIKTNKSCSKYKYNNFILLRTINPNVFGMNHYLQLTQIGKVDKHFRVDGG